MNSLPPHLSPVQKPAGAVPIGSFVDASLMAELRRLEILTKRMMTSELAGAYRSAFRGSGLLFSDLREYQPGDDLRTIHWKATARTGHPFVKNFEEDRELSIMLALDHSRSIAAGFGVRSIDSLRRFGALVTLLAGMNRDAVGLINFTDTVENFVPVKRGRTHSERVLRELLYTPPTKKATDINCALQFIARHQRRRSTIFLVSDFFSPPFEQSLASVTHRHDLIGVLLTPTMKAAPPYSTLIEVEDAENENVLWWMIKRYARPPRAAWRMKIF